MTSRALRLLSSLLSLAVLTAAGVTLIILAARLAPTFEKVV